MRKYFLLLPFLFPLVSFASITVSNPTYIDVGVTYGGDVISLDVSGTCVGSPSNDSAIGVLSSDGVTLNFYDFYDSAYKAVTGTGTPFSDCMDFLSTGTVYVELIPDSYFLPFLLGESYFSDEVSWIPDSNFIFVYPVISPIVFPLYSSIMLFTVLGLYLMWLFVMLVLIRLILLFVGIPVRWFLSSLQDIIEII